MGLNVLIYPILALLILTIGSTLHRLLQGRRFQKLIVCLVSFCLLFLVFALKDPLLGTDMPAYFEIYEKVGSMSFSSVVTAYKKDLFFYLFLYCFSALHVSFRLFMIFYYLVAFSCLGFFSYRFTLRSDYFVFLFVCFPSFGFSFSILREFLAACLVMAGMPFLRRKNLGGFLLFLLFFCLAVGIHSGAVVALIIPFLFWIRPGSFPLFSILLFTILVLVVLPDSLSFLIERLNNQYQAGNYSVSIKYLIFYFSLFLFSYFFFSDCSFLTFLSAKIHLQEAAPRNPIYKTELYSVCVFFLVFFFFYFTKVVSTNLFRLGIYFLLPALAGLSDFDEKTLVKNYFVNCSGKIFVFFMALFVLFSSTSSNNVYGYVPYRLGF